MEILSEAPQTSSFVPVAEHQSITPASFHGGPPVLHYYSDRCKVIVLDDDLQFSPALSNLVLKASQPAHSNEPRTTSEENGTNGTHATQKTLEEVDVWVTSEKLLLFSHTALTGLSIPYPKISIHATQTYPAPAPTEPSSQALYMQLIPSLPDSNDDDEPPDTISLTIIPTASAAPTANSDDPVESEDKPQLTPVQALYKALSDCSDLHPDPEDDEDDEEGAGGLSRLMAAGLAIPGTTDGSMPPAMPGSGGWITAENMHEFVDEDGNFRDDVEIDGEANADDNEELGPGAGTVRTREVADGEGDGAKWQRTS